MGKITSVIGSECSHIADSAHFTLPTFALPPVTTNHQLSLKTNDLWPPCRAVLLPCERRATLLPTQLSQKIRGTLPSERDHTKQRGRAKW